MPEGTGSPDVGPPKPPPPEADGGTASSPRGPETRASSPLTDPSLASALERMASVDPRVARLMEDPPTEAAATSPAEVVRLETPAGAVIDFDPAHPMTEDPVAVISRSREGLKTPKEPTGMLDPDYLRGIGPGHPDWASLTPEQREIADRLRAAAARAERDRLGPRDERGRPYLEGDLAEGGAPGERVETLQYFDREILRVVRALGSFEERDNNYRVSREGRDELAKLQGELRGIYQKRLDRINSALPKAEARLSEADRGLSELMDRLPDERKRDYEKMIRDIRIEKKDRHLQKEVSYRVMTAEELVSETTTLETEKSNLEAETRRLERNIAKNMKYLTDIQGTSLEGEEMAVRAREYIRKYSPVVEENVKQLPILERKINSTCYCLAEKRVEGLDRTDPDQKPLIELLDADRAYRQVLGEREATDTERAQGIFSPDIPLAEAVKEYDRQKGADARKSTEAKSTIEGYFREAKRRGYFDELEEEILRIVNSHRSPYEHGRPISISSIGERAQAEILAYIDMKSRGADTYVQDVVAKRVAEGKAAASDHGDLPSFAGLTQLWLDRVGGAIRDISRGQAPGKEFDGEFSIVSGGPGWTFSEAGYVMLDRDLVTVEDYEKCILSFANFLISGAIDRDPAKLFQEMQQFERIFSQSVVKNLAGPGVDRNEYARRWRLTLKGVVTFWAADYFGSMANTPNVQAVLQQAFTGDEGVDLISQSMRAYDGLAGLAMRKIERKRRYRRPLHQYFGENGGLAFEGGHDEDLDADPRSRDLRTGSLEYLVRSKTEYLLAEDIMVFEMGDTASGELRYVGGSERDRLRNLDSLGLYQTSSNFEGKFVVNQRVLAIREKVRSGGLAVLSQEELILYKAKLDRAQEAVDFARKMSGALGERAKNAAPAYIVKVYKRNAQGKLVNEHGEELRKPEKKGWWARGRERIVSPIHSTKKLWHYMRTGKEDEHHGAHVYINGEPVVERTDYLDKNYSIRFMQFAENAARILAEQENKRRIAAGKRPLNAYEITKKAHEMRRRARAQLFAKGYGARLVDEKGYPIYFSVRGERIDGADYQDGVKVDIDTGTTLRDDAERDLADRGIVRKQRRKGKEVLVANVQAVVLEKAVSLARDAGRVGSEDSFRAEAERLLVEKGVLKRESGKLSAVVSVLVAERAVELAETRGLVSLDFDEITTHVLSQSCKEIYLSLQQEIRSQLLRSSTREAALRIRRGVSRPEEEDVLASMLLQIDPTLTRLRATSDDGNIELIGAQVYGSFWSHFRIMRELDRQSIDEETGRQEVYYGVPNERFAWKELLWSSNKLSREAKRYGRRGWLFFANSPVHAMSFAERFGTDISASVGIMHRSDYLAKKTEMEVTDANVLADIVDRIGKAYQVMVLFAKGGQLGDRKITPLALKPFDNIDGAEVEHIEQTVSNRALVMRIFQKLKENLGRCEAVLKGIEEQDNPVATSGAMHLETTDVRYVTRDGRRVVPTDLDIRFVAKDGTIIEERPEGNPNEVYERAEVLFHRTDGTASGSHGRRLDADGYVVEKKKRKRVFGLLGMPYISGEPEWANILSVDTTLSTGSGALMAEEWFESTFIPYANSLGKEQYKDQAWVIDYMNKRMGVGSLDTFWKWFASKAIRAGGPSQ